MSQTTLQPRSLGTIDTSSLDPVQRVLLGFLARYREPTRSNYYTDLEQYAGWCETQHVTMLGVGPLELQLYIEYLRSQGLAQSHRRPALRHPVNTRNRNLAMVLLMGVMGLRVGEVCGLNIEGLVEAEGQPAIKFIGKRQKVATMVLPWEVLQTTRATIGDRTTGPVFVKMQGPLRPRRDRTGRMSRTSSRTAHHAALIPPVLRQGRAHAGTAVARDPGGAQARRSENDGALHRH